LSSPPKRNAIAQMTIDVPAEPERSITAPPAGPGDLGAVAIRGGAIRVVGYMAGVLVSLAAATILVRYLGVASFGRYVTVTSLIALVGGVTEAGIVVYGIREFTVRGDRDRRHLMGNLLAMRLSLTLAGIACAACFGLVAGYRHVLVLGILVAGAGLMLQVTADVLSVPLQAQLLLGRLSLAELSRRVLTLVLIAVLALAGASFLPFLAAPTTAAAVALVLIARMVRRYVAIRLRFDWPVWRGLFTQTLPYAVALSIAAIYLYVTVIIMSLIATATQTGLFATSFRVTQAGLAIPSLLLTAIFPLMSRLGHDQQVDLGPVVGRVFSVALICGVWMSLVTALGASFIIDLIAGSQGRGAVPVLRIQGLTFIVSFVSTSSALGLISIRRYRPLLVASLSTLILNILLGLVLVPALGARGGAIADVLTEAAAAMGLTFVLIRSVSQHQIRPALAGPVVLASLLSAAVLLLPVGPLIRAIAATPIYFGVLLRTGALPHEITDAARRLRGLRTLS
jgi:O-antigen/teichoic acid export membrane protein